MTLKIMKTVIILTGKFFLYILVSIFVIWSMSSLNINGIFKKGKVYEARVFYFFLGLSVIYLVTNCIYDVFLNFS